MALDVTAGAAPAFLRKNWINSDSRDYGTLTASELPATVERVIDGDKDSQWNSSNATDGTSVAITADLRELESLVARNIDLIVLQNINLKNFLLEYSTTGTGGSWVTVPGGDYQSGVADFSGTDFQLSLSTQLTGVKALRLTMTHTQTANEIKKVGGFIASELVVQFSYAMDKYKKEPVGNRKDLILGNGKISREHLMRSAYSDVRWRFDAKLSNIPEAEILTAIDLRKRIDDFIFYPEPADAKGDIFVGFYAKEPKIDYTTKFKGAGYNLDFSFAEAVSA